MKRFPIWIGNVLCAAPVIALACTISTPAVAQTAEPTALRTDTIYETNYQTGAVELYSARGKDLGAVGRLSFPTGLTFDKARETHRGEPRHARGDYHHLGTR